MKRHSLVLIVLFAVMLALGATACGGGDDNPDGDAPDGDTDGDNPDGDTPDGDSPDGDNPDGDTPDGDTPDGDTPDGDTDGDSPDGDADGDTDGDTPDGDADGDIDGDSDGDTPDGDVDSDTPDGDTDGDAEGDVDADIDGDSDTDADIDGEETPLDPFSDCSCACPLAGDDFEDGSTDAWTIEQNGYYTLSTDSGTGANGTDRALYIAKIGDDGSSNPGLMVRHEKCQTCGLSFYIWAESCPIVNGGMNYFGNYDDGPVLVSGFGMIKDDTQGIDTAQLVFINSNFEISSLGACQDQTWYHIQYKYDWYKKTMDVYVDGELRLEDMDINPLTTGISASIFFHSKAGTAGMIDEIEFTSDCKARECRTCSGAGDDFEDGTYDAWDDSHLTAHRVVVDDATAAEGSYSLSMTRNDIYDGHGGGLSQTFDACSPDALTFWVYSDACPQTDQTGQTYVVTATNSTFYGLVSTFAIFRSDIDGITSPSLALSSSSSYYPLVECTDNTWYKVRLEYDWANKTIDAFVDGVRRQADIPFQLDAETSIACLIFYHFSRESSGRLDDIKFLTRSGCDDPATTTPGDDFESGTWDNWAVIAQSDSYWIQPTDGSEAGNDYYLGVSDIFPADPKREGLRQTFAPIKPCGLRYRVKVGTCPHPMSNLRYGAVSLTNSEGVAMLYTWFTEGKLASDVGYLADCVDDQWFELEYRFDWSANRYTLWVNDVLTLDNQAFGVLPHQGIAGIDLYNYSYSYSDWAGFDEIEFLETCD